MVCVGGHVNHPLTSAPRGNFSMQPAMTSRLAAALDYADVIDDDARPHYLHQACEMLGDIADLDNLSTGELVALVALLIPAHSRVLLARVGAASDGDGHRVLRLVVPHSEPPAQLG